MNTFRLSNVSLRGVRKVLVQQGLTKQKMTRGRGGHEKWVKAGMPRPIILQTHVDPVPEPIVRQIMRHLNLSRKEFANLIQSQ